jgi:AcrR family transcriptional regulator
VSSRQLKAAREIGSTRELLLQEAERQIALKGLDAVTLKDLADPLGIRVPSIYAHFSSREDLLAAVTARYVGALAEFFPDDGQRDPTTVLMEGVRGLVVYFASNPAHVRLKLRDLETPGGRSELALGQQGDAGGSGSDSGPLRPLIDRIDGLLKRGVATGAFRPVDPVNFYRTVLGITLLSLTCPTADIFTSARDPQEISRILPFTEDVVRRFVCV